MLGKEELNIEEQAPVTVRDDADLIKRLVARLIAEESDWVSRMGRREVLNTSHIEWGGFTIGESNPVDEDTSLIMMFRERLFNVGNSEAS